MNTAVISFGSNIEPEVNIPQARSLVNGLGSIIRESRFIHTSPIGMPKQPYFMNGVVLIHTALSRVELTEKLKKIEQTLGRERQHSRYSPRTIDLDIIVWNDRIVDKNFYTWDFLKTLVHEIYPASLKIEKDEPSK